MGERPACQAEYMELAEKYSMKPWRRRRRGRWGDQGPMSRVREWRLAKPAKGRLVKSRT